MTITSTMAGTVLKTISSRNVKHVLTPGIIWHTPLEDCQFPVGKNGSSQLVMPSTLIGIFWCSCWHEISKSLTWPYKLWDAHLNVCEDDFSNGRNSTWNYIKQRCQTCVDTRNNLDARHWRTANSQLVKTAVPSGWCHLPRLAFFGIHIDMRSSTSVRMTSTMAGAVSRTISSRGAKHVLTPGIF